MKRLEIKSIVRKTFFYISSEIVSDAFFSAVERTSPLSTSLRRRKSLLLETSKSDTNIESQQNEMSAVGKIETKSQHNLDEKRTCRNSQMRATNLVRASCSDVEWNLRESKTLPGATAAVDSRETATTNKRSSVVYTRQACKLIEAQTRIGVRRNM